MDATNLITVGPYCFVVSNCVILGGIPQLAQLPLPAPQDLTDPWNQHSGQTAHLVKPIDPTAAYLSLSVGCVE